MLLTVCKGFGRETGGPWRGNAECPPADRFQGAGGGRRSALQQREYGNKRGRCRKKRKAPKHHTPPPSSLYPCQGLGCGAFCITNAPAVGTDFSRSLGADHSSYSVTQSRMASSWTWTDGSAPCPFLAAGLCERSMRAKRRQDSNGARFTLQMMTRHGHSHVEPSRDGAPGRGRGGGVDTGISSDLSQSVHFASPRRQNEAILASARDKIFGVS